MIDQNIQIEHVANRFKLFDSINNTCYKLIEINF